MRRELSDGLAPLKRIIIQIDCLQSDFLSSSVKQDLFAQKVSLQEEVLTPQVHTELAQKLEDALLTLQGAL